ncbi:hypothetical protein LPW11_16910 [Geomonas sp. RF6]|uniref:hypothetical protein n=1 Tax=Geomonas sp. RF6 TaxID=2897342 RepID=UPI001E461327|nr:hypothetical protein [Geomonas sp. RF6]UFS69568.1 hypothetical protein LPW11_16910 [Geomonas sp. RF6]
MKELTPDGQDLRQAVKWVSEKLQEHPEKKFQHFVHDATLKFNLTPKDSELLIDFFVQRKEHEK